MPNYIYDGMLVHSLCAQVFHVVCTFINKVVSDYSMHAAFAH
jgi:hypothetical protein